jgi:geranylgeranyl pyrophosphate synthase
MDKAVYFNAMREFSSKVWPYILEALNNKASPISQLISPQFHKILNKRQRRGLLMKPFLMKLAADASGYAGEPEVIHRIAAATELLNISSYQCNSALDEKNEVRAPLEKDEQFIAGMLSREALEDLVIGTQGLDAGIQRQIIHLLSQTNAAIYQGQYLDVVALTRDKWDLKTGKEKFKASYLLRCELLSGIFDQNCAAIGALIAHANQDVVNRLAEFGLNFGIAHQIANDIGDLVYFKPPMASSKDYQDQFSDLRNGRLTFPIYVLEAICQNKVLEEIDGSSNGKKALTDQQKANISRLFVRTGAYAESRRLALFFVKKARHSLHHLPDSHAIPALSCMVSVARTNKYYHRLIALSKDINENVVMKKQQNTSNLLRTCDS